MQPFFRDNLSNGGYIAVKELNQDPELFKSLYTMSTESFPLLVVLTGPEVQRMDTDYHKAVTAEERLMITLR